jgi:integrase
MVEKSPGVWRLRVYLGRDPVKGTPRQQQVTFRGGEKAAGRELARLVTAAQRDQTTATASTVGHLLDRWLEAIGPTRAPGTIAGYRMKIESRIRPAVGAVPLDRLSAHDLDRFYALSLSDGLSTTTVHQLHAILSAALRQAERWGWVDQSPARKASPPPVRRTQPKVPTPVELREMVDACHDSDPVLAAAVALAAMTGCRRGELVALRWSDIDLYSRTITVARSVAVVSGRRFEGPTKTHQVRRIALDDVCCDVVRYRMTQQRELSDRAASPLVGDPYLLTFRADAAEPVHPDTLTYHFNKLSGGRFRFHDLRHFSVTTLIAAGVDVRTVAERHGHAQATMTLNRYAHALPQRDRDSADILGRALSPP